MGNDDISLTVDNRYRKWLQEVQTKLGKDPKILEYDVNFSFIISIKDVYIEDLKQVQDQLKESQDPALKVMNIAIMKVIVMQSIIDLEKLARKAVAALKKEKDITSESLTNDVPVAPSIENLYQYYREFDKIKIEALEYSGSSKFTNTEKREIERRNTEGKIKNYIESFDNLISRFYGEDVLVSESNPKGLIKYLESDMHKLYFDDNFFANSSEQRELIIEMRSKMKDSTHAKAKKVRRLLTKIDTNLQKVQSSFLANVSDEIVFNNYFDAAIQLTEILEDNKVYHLFNEECFTNFKMRVDALEKYKIDFPQRDKKEEVVSEAPVTVVHKRF